MYDRLEICLVWLEAIVRLDAIRCLSNDIAKEGNIESANWMTFDRSSGLSNYKFGMLVKSLK